MRLKFSFFILLIFSNVTLFSQDGLFTVEEAAIGQYRQLAPKTMVQLQWRPGYEAYTFIEDNSLKQFSVEVKKISVLIDTKEIGNLINSENLTVHSVFPQYRWINPDELELSFKEGYVVIDINTKKLVTVYRIPEESANAEFCVQNRLFAYTKSNNLYIIDEKGKETRLTSENDKGIVSGQTVHRNEFGIEKGTFWSNTGKYLAYYRMDETMVTDYPLVDIKSRIASLENIKYPMAGMTSHKVRIAVYNILSKETIYLKTGLPEDQYLTNISWSADDKYIYAAVLNREQNYMKFNRYDVITGNFIETLFEEKNERYVEPLTPAVFLKKRNEFIWQSQRDGFNHLYLYDNNGKPVKQLTSGEWVVTGFLGFDEDEKNIFFISTEKSPLERHLYSVNIETGKKKCLTSAGGCHSAEISSSGKYFIDNFSSVDVPNLIALYDIEGLFIKELLNSENPLKDFLMPEMKFIKIKSADSVTDLHGRIIYPLNFDKSKKYPVILYVYGGPHAQMVKNSWLGGAWLWDYYMAQKGYILLTVDNRGSANRGFEFESIIHRNIGEYEATDQYEAVNYILKQGIADESRFGVYGWSYGGYMTISLMTKYPGIFKTGVAGGPVTDWKYYEVMYGERYMDTPEENIYGYNKSSLLNKAGNLKGKLLIIHGYKDETVVLQHTLSFVQECIKSGSLPDLFIFPNQAHNVRGFERIELMKKITRYFEDNL